MNRKRGHNVLLSESESSKIHSVYVLIANNDQSRCKVGHTSSSTNYLHNRYCTALPTMKIWLFLPSHKAQIVEQKTLAHFAASRQLNSNGRASEWINVAVQEVSAIVTQFLVDSEKTLLRGYSNMDNTGEQNSLSTCDDEQIPDLEDNTGEQNNLSTCDDDEQISITTWKAFLPTSGINDVHVHCASPPRGIINLRNTNYWLPFNEEEVLSVWLSNYEPTNSNCDVDAIAKDIVSTKKCSKKHTRSRELLYHEVLARQSGNPMVILNLLTLEAHDVVTSDYFSQREYKFEDGCWRFFQAYPMPDIKNIATKPRLARVFLSAFLGPWEFLKPLAQSICHYNSAVKITLPKRQHIRQYCFWEFFVCVVALLFGENCVRFISEKDNTRVAADKSLRLIVVTRALPPAKRKKLDDCPYNVIYANSDNVLPHRPQNLQDAVDASGKYAEISNDHRFGFNGGDIAMENLFQCRETGLFWDTLKTLLED